MKKLIDKTERKIQLYIEPYEINNLIYIELRKNGYNFEEKEIELKYDFVKEGSPEYTTSKLKCNVIITKDLSDVT